MEADALAQSKQFLKQIINERLSTPPDEFVHPCLAGNYSLKPEEIKGEVCDWVLNYLEQSHCPHQLAIFIAATVAGQISASVIEKLSQSGDDDPNPTVNASTLHAEVLSFLHDLCCQFLAAPRKMAACNFQRVLPFSSSIFAIKNKRRKMEDRHVVIHDLNSLLNLEALPPLSFYAVYDGHAGIDAANFAAAHLHENIIQHPDFSTDTVLAIKEAYKLTDAHICERALREGIKGGCTVISALFRDKTMYLSWVGDSQGILIKQGKPITIMDPHMPDREDERKRIEDAGGFIYFLGTWRVNGTLAVARSLGDHEFKPHVSSEPDVTVITLDGSEDFLVLACDGLWDGMSEEDVTAVLYRNILDQSDDECTLVETLAEKLVHQSKLQGSEDNISVVVVLLRNIADIRASASAFSESTLHMNGKSENYVINVDESILQQQFENNSISDIVVQNPIVERPKDLHDLTSFPSLNNPFDEYSPSRSPNHGLATCLPPEATALSELPTPPIDDIASPGQFSELTSAEQIEQLQYHLETTDFQGASFGECVLNKPDNHTDINDLQKSENPVLEPPDFYTTEVNSCTVFPVNELSVRDVSPEKVAMDIASDIISSTIESAMEKVNLSTEAVIVSEINGTPHSRLNPNAEPFVMKNFSPQSPVSTDVSPMSSDSAQPIAVIELNPFLIDNSKGNSSEPLFSEDSLPELELGEKSKEFVSVETNICLENRGDFVTFQQSAVEGIKQDFTDLDALNTHLITEPIAEKSCLMESGVSEQIPQLLEPLSAESVSNPDLNIVDSNEQLNNDDSGKSTEEIKGNEATEEIKESGSTEEIKEDKASKEVMEGQVSEEIQVPSSPVGLTSFPQSCTLHEVPSEISKTNECNAEHAEMEHFATEVLKMEETTKSDFLENLKDDTGFKNSSNNEHIPIDIDQNHCTQSNIEHSKSECPIESIDSIVNDLKPDVNDLLPAGDASQQIVDTESIVSQIISEQVIGLSEDICQQQSVESIINNLPADYAFQQIVDAESGVSAIISKQIIGLSKDECQPEPIESIVNYLKSDNDLLPIGDASQQIANVESNISPIISKQVIGVDSLLPKEVQVELLKAAENTPPETAPEDSHAIAVAVDLKSIPDGVPEADGVSEDVDSDSEKDGGWSYVKANEGLGTKTESSDPKASATKIKSVEKKPLAKKVPLKPLKDTFTKSKISSLSDKAKKLPIERKINDIKPNSIPKSSTTTAKQTPISKTVKPPLNSVNKSVPPKPTVESNLTATKPAVSRSAVKAPAPTSKAVAKTNVQVSTVKIKTTTVKTTITATSLSSRPTMRPIGTTSKDKVPTNVVSRSGASAQVKPSTRPTATPQEKKTIIPSRQPSKPITGGENKTSVFKAPLPVTKKPEVKNVNKETVIRKLPSTTQPIPRPPQLTSTPKLNSAARSKTPSQPGVNRSAALTKAHSVEPSKQHVGLKPPRTVFKGTSDKNAKNRKDIGKKPSELVAKSRSKTKAEQPKIETKEEEFMSEVIVKETESISNDAPATEQQETPTTIEDEVKQEEVLVEPIATENPIIML